MQLRVKGDKTSAGRQKQEADAVNVDLSIPPPLRARTPLCWRFTREPDVTSKLREKGKEALSPWKPVSLSFPRDVRTRTRCHCTDLGLSREGGVVECFRTAADFVFTSSDGRLHELAFYCLFKVELRTSAIYRLVNDFKVDFSFKDLQTHARSLAVTVLETRPMISLFCFAAAWCVSVVSDYVIKVAHPSSGPAG